MSRNRKRLSTLEAVMLVVIIVIPVLSPGAWAASNYKTLYKFTGAWTERNLLLAWSSTRPGISTARQSLAALMVEVLSSSWHRTRTGVGGRACCIASARARTVSTERPRLLA
jgi:hypothetical protein